MARARNIKPQIARNEDLAELPFQYRLGFIYSWMFADFRGVIQFRPKRLKADLFPYDDVDIEDFVNCTAKAGFFQVFTVQGQRYIKIVKFERHQNPHKHEREAGTELPDITDADPPEATDKKEVAAKAVQSTDKAETSTSPAVLLTDSLIIDSLIPDSEREADKPPATVDKTPAAIKLVKKISGTSPNKAIWDDLIDVLGDKPDEERLKTCFKTWVAKGFKAKNLAWISDWYVKGIPNYQNGNGKPKPFDPGKQRPDDAEPDNSKCKSCFDSGYDPVIENGQLVRKPCPSCSVKEKAA